MTHFNNKFMNIIFCCQSTDTNDPIIADTVSRIRQLSTHKKVNDVDVVCLKKGKVEFGKNVTVTSIKETSNNRLTSLLLLYRKIFEITALKRIHTIYLYMVPSWALVLLPIQKILKIQIVIWFCHTQIDLTSAIACKYIANKWITSNKSMVPLKSKNIFFAGQGIDPQKFYSQDLPKIFDLITIGRITPIKKLEVLLDAIKECEAKYNKKYSLAIGGDAYTLKDEEYKQKILLKIKNLRLESRIYHLGFVDHEILPKLLNQAKCFVFTVPGGIGKASIEAMACGIPLIISSPEADDFFTDELNKWFLCKNTVNKVAENMYSLLEADQHKLASLKEQMQELFYEKYTLNKFTDRVVSIIDK